MTCSPAAAAILGYQPSELVGQLVALIAPNTDARWRDRNKLLVSPTGRYVGARTLRHKDGSERWYRGALQLQPDRDHVAITFELLAERATERERVQSVCHA